MKQISGHSKPHKSLKTEPGQALGKPRHSALGEPPPLPVAVMAASSTAPSTVSHLEPQAHGGALKRTESSLEDSEIISPDPKKQWWRREPTSKTRKIAEKFFVKKAAGRSHKEIAKLFNTTESNVTTTIYIARKNGWVDKDDETVDMEAELACDVDRKLIRNLSASLDGQMTNWQTHEMTLAGLKGRGHFRNHDAKTVEGAQTLGIIGVQIIMPALGQADQAMLSSVADCGGVPEFIDGDVAE